ncbi:MAG: aromatic amino acid lyase, partial [Acidobacteriota bacterium]
RAHQARRDDARPPVRDYGVTTGFGAFKEVAIAPEQLDDLQRNLLLSHQVGVGDTTDPDDPGNHFSADVVRATLAIRLNAFLKGHSGVRPALLDTIAAMLTRGIVPLVPVRGSLGSSGDLCPLAHLFGVLLGTGRYYCVTTPADVGHRGGHELRPASRLTEDLGAAPAVPRVKEGLALINGATVSTAALAIAVRETEVLLDLADACAALSLEAICGGARALDPQIHRARGQRGQIDSAANLRALLQDSRLLDAAGAVQDPYSLRCAPAVHGASRDAVAFARMLVERELNAATDNPLFFPALDDPWDHAYAANWPEGYDGRRRASFSGANVHGQPIALAADVLAIAAAEIGAIAERRTQLLLDPHHNRNLPHNLIADGGLQSGLMLAQYSAAALVLENRALAHPASIDSLPTAGNIEDHVANATVAARKARTIVGNAQATLAIELLTAAQAVEWRVAFERAPRAGASDPTPDAATFAEAVSSQPARQRIANRLGRGTAGLYRAIRAVVPPVTEDRALDADIRALWRMVEDGSLNAAIDAALLRPLRAWRETP